MAWGELELRPERRAIVHLNVADFAVAVERVVDPRLRQRPVIVAPLGAARAAVYDMSEEAFREGVRKGMALERARRFCRGAELVEPHPDHYQRAMKALVKEAHPYSPLVESGEGNGHLFLDLTGTGRLFGPPWDVAWRIRKAVRGGPGFDPIWSVAPNKLVAKVATRLVKPTGEYIVKPGEEEEFLSPLPLSLLPGLEGEELLALREFNLFRVGQAAAWGLEELNTVLGRRGLFLYRAVRGIDPSPVRPGDRKEERVAAEHLFDDDTNNAPAVEAALFGLVERVGLELRERGLAARRAGVRVDYSDGVRVVRQRTHRSGTALDGKLFALARAALDLAWVRRVRLRRLRLVCDRLTSPPGQGELFPQEERAARSQERLMAAVDLIRSRFGRQAIRTGPGLAMGTA